MFFAMFLEGKLDGQLGCSTVAISFFFRVQFCVNSFMGVFRFGGFNGFVRRLCISGDWFDYTWCKNYSNGTIFPFQRTIARPDADGVLALVEEMCTKLRGTSLTRQGQMPLCVFFLSVASFFFERKQTGRFPTHDSRRGCIPEADRSMVLTFARDSLRRFDQTLARASCLAVPPHLAYIIYTSNREVGLFLRRSTYLTCSPQTTATYRCSTTVTFLNRVTPTYLQN